MDLIYTDSNRIDIGVIGGSCKIDFVTGLYGSQNDFTIDIPYSLYDPLLGHGSIIHTDGEEVGGYVLGIESNTKTETVKVHGVNWRGLVAQKVIEPIGDYYETNVDALEMLRNLLDPSFDGIIVGASGTCGMTVTRKFRYDNMLEGIELALADVGMRIEVSFDVDHAVFNAVPIETMDIELSNDYGLNIIAKDVHDGYNHVIALGQGELSQRQKVDAWLLSSGSVTFSKVEAEADGIVGANERTMAYDYPNAETAEDLANGAIERLLKNADTVSFAMSGNERLEVGNIVPAKERFTGIYMEKKVTSRLYKGYLDDLKIENRIGE